MLAGTANSDFATRSSPPDRFRPGPIAVVTAPTRVTAANCTPRTRPDRRPAGAPARDRGELHAADRDVGRAVELARMRPQQTRRDRDGVAAEGERQVRVRRRV